MNETQKNPMTMAPAEFAAHLRHVLETFRGVREDALRFVKQHPGARNLWRTRAARFEAWRCTRTLRRLEQQAFTLPSTLVRRVFENGRWRVQEHEGDLFVNGLLVWPVPMPRLADTIDILEFRRRLNLVPEYDAHHG